MYVCNVCMRMYVCACMCVHVCVRSLIALQVAIVDRIVVWLVLCVVCVVLCCVVVCVLCCVCECNGTRIIAFSSARRKLGGLPATLISQINLDQLLLLRFCCCHCSSRA